MAKRKAAKSKPGAVEGNQTDQKVEPMVIALAEKIGAFLGRVQRKADGLLDKDALRKQATQIRDDAADLWKEVGKGSSSKTGARGGAKKSKAKGSAKARAAAAADAPLKRNRRPPPQELFDPRLGEPMGKQMGQKNLKRRGRG
jgi:hypothetical protein